MDLYLFHLLNRFAGKWGALDAAAVFFAKYSGYVLAVVVIFIFWKHWRIIFQVFLTAIISRFVITEIIRFLWHRSRPFVENHITPIISQSPGEPSFPSGHAAFYFAIAAVVYFYNKKAGLLFFLAAFLISLARVFAGVHWPSDILAGALVGILSGWLINKISKKIS